MRAVTLLIADLGPGGAQRVLTWLANRWIAQGRDVELLTLAPDGEAPHHPLDPGVRIRGLGLTGPSGGSLVAAARNAWRIDRLAAALRAGPPAPVVSFADTTNVLACAAGTLAGRPVIVSERTDPRNAPPARAWAVLRPWAYRLADRVVVQTPAAREFLGPPLADRVEVLPNPVHVPEPTANARPRAGIGAMGRLHPEKGFDRLLEAFALLAPEHPDVDLTVWGEGPARADLEALRDRRNLADRVAFPGLTDAPWHALGGSVVFALPSRVEGFPNVLLEAMAAGTPVAAFASSAGIAEILDHGRLGRLVPDGDVAGLARALAELLGSPAERRRLAAEARRSLRRYDPHRIGRAWDRLLDRASGAVGAGAEPAEEHGGRDRVHADGRQRDPRHSEVP